MHPDESTPKKYVQFTFDTFLLATNFQPNQLNLAIYNKPIIQHAVHMSSSIYYIILKSQNIYDEQCSNLFDDLSNSRSEFAPQKNVLNLKHEMFLQTMHKEEKEEDCNYIPVNVNVISLQLLLASEAGAQEVAAAPAAAAAGGRGGAGVALHHPVGLGGCFRHIHGGGGGGGVHRLGLQDAVPKYVGRLGIRAASDDAGVVLRLLDLARRDRADEPPDAADRRRQRARPRDLAAAESEGAALGIGVSATGSSGLRTRLQIPVEEHAARHGHTAGGGGGGGGRRGAGHRLGELPRARRVPAAAVLGQRGERLQRPDARAEEEAVLGGVVVGGGGEGEADRLGVPPRPRRPRRPEQERLGVQRRRRAPRRRLPAIPRPALRGQPNKQPRHGEQRRAAAATTSNPPRLPAAAAGVRVRHHHPPQHRRQSKSHLQNRHET